jgi:hypothetical protein
MFFYLLKIYQQPGTGEDLSSDKTTKLDDDVECMCGVFIFYQ